MQGLERDTEASRPSRVFVVGHYGVPNLGDETILETIERAAEANGASVVGYSSRTPGTPDARAVRLRGRAAARYLRLLVTADRLVLGGGGILKDEGLGLLLELLIASAVTRLRGRPVVLLAVGVGPFYSRPGRILTRLVSRLANVRTVRDEPSRAALRALGVRRVHAGADPVLSAFAPDSPLRGPRRERTEHPRLVVSVRPWLRARDGAATEASERLEAAIATVLDALVAEGWEVRWVTMYRGRDEHAASDIAARMDGATTVAPPPLRWDALMDEVQDADLVLAMRYHALAAAALASKPAIALAYEPKVRALADELGVDVLDPADPALASALAATVRAAAAGVRTGERPSLPDAGAVARLRAAAGLALERALVGSR